jgi:hypothetical protein
MVNRDEPVRPWVKQAGKNAARQFKTVVSKTGVCPGSVSGKSGLSNPVCGVLVLCHARRIHQPDIASVASGSRAADGTASRPFQRDQGHSTVPASACTCASDTPAACSPSALTGVAGFLGPSIEHTLDHLVSKHSGATQNNMALELWSQSCWLRHACVPPLKHQPD